MSIIGHSLLACCSAFGVMPIPYPSRLWIVFNHFAKSGGSTIKVQLVSSSRVARVRPPGTCATSVGLKNTSGMTAATPAGTAFYPPTPTHCTYVRERFGGAVESRCPVGRTKATIYEYIKTAVNWGNGRGGSPLLLGPLFLIVESPRPSEYLVFSAVLSFEIFLLFSRYTCSATLECRLRCVHL